VKFDFTKGEIDKLSIQTILFDLDGTLIDTNELIISSFQHTFDYYDLKFSREEILHFNGPPLRDTFHAVNPQLADEMVRVYREHNIKNHDALVEAFPGVVDTVAKLYSKGYGLGIVTAKVDRTVDMGLELTGLNKFFNTVITFNDVTHSKPHPEPVFKAMKELNANPATTIMIGDNSHDIEAGKNAGIRTAGVAWSDKGRAFLESFKPTYMLETMEDLLDIVGS